METFEYESHQNHRRTRQARSGNQYRGRKESWDLFK